jgi:hypothetical protein
MTVCVEIEVENTILVPTDKSGHIERKILLKENSGNEGSENIRRD